MVVRGATGDTVDTARVGVSFVAPASAISQSLVDIVSRKACQVTISYEYKDTAEESSVVYGSGGVLRGPEIRRERVQETEDEQARSPARKKARRFLDVASYEGTLVTAKHNLVPEEEEVYVQTTLRFPETNPLRTVMPDGGTTITDYITVRDLGDNVIQTEDNDFSFGARELTEGKVTTKEPFLFVQVPNTFLLQVGHKIGIAVFRSYEITHEDAEAPNDVDLATRFGSVNQPCIYCGKVTEISANGKTFLHNINTFTGCSGAVIFLLDIGQDKVDQAFDSDMAGMAVGIHTSGLDANNNLGFMLPPK